MNKSRYDTYSIGYFCDYGKKPTKIHLIVNGYSVCGKNSKMQYHWCAQTLRGRNYITCRKCKEKALEMILNYERSVNDDTYKYGR